MEVRLERTRRFSVYGVGREEDDWRSQIMAHAVLVLRTGDIATKAALSRTIGAAWAADRLGKDGAGLPGVSRGSLPPPAPCRAVPQPRVRGDGQPIVEGVKRLRLLHGICHAESYAIDLFWDAIARFGGDETLPREFFDDFVAAAAEEARHYTSWAERLAGLGCPYGSLPSHGGLWESAARTAGDAIARLAVIHCCHEARGLDTYHITKGKLERAGDAESLAVLEVNIREEVHHVRKGVKWLTFLAEQRGEDPRESFRGAIARHFDGELKPPFDAELRAQAGMPADWYCTPDARGGFLTGRRAA